MVTGTINGGIVLDIDTDVSFDVANTARLSSSMPNLVVDDNSDSSREEEENALMRLRDRSSTDDEMLNGSLSNSTHSHSAT